MENAVQEHNKNRVKNKKASNRCQVDMHKTRIVQDNNRATRTFLEEAFDKTKWVTLSFDGYVIAQHNNFSV